MRWELFTPSDRTTVCPFKGVASYLEPHRPGTRDLRRGLDLPNSASRGLRDSRARLVLLPRIAHGLWRTGRTAQELPATFPLWGDVDELIRLIDVEPVAERQFADRPTDRRAETSSKAASSPLKPSWRYRKHLRVGVAFPPP